MGENPPRNLGAAKTKNTISPYFIVNRKQIRLLANRAFASTEKTKAGEVPAQLNDY
jgi:hypothetical protein